MKFFDTNPPGRIISRISKDIEMIDDYVPWIINCLLWDIGDLITVPIAVMIQFPIFSVVVLISGVLVYLIQIQFRPANR